MSSQWKDYEAIIDNFPDDESEPDSTFMVSDYTFLSSIIMKTNHV